MCDAGLFSGPTIAALLAGAAGTAIQYTQQRSAAKRQESAIEQAREEQSQFADQRTQQLAANAQRYAAPDAQTALREAIAQPAARLESVAQDAAASTAAAPVAASGSVSQDYVTGRADRAAEELSRAITNAQLMARAGAGGRMQFEEQLGAASDADAVDAIGSRMRRAADGSSVAISRAGRTSPGAMAMGSLLQTAGSAMGTYAAQQPAAGAYDGASWSGATGLDGAGGDLARRRAVRGGIFG